MTRQDLDIDLNQAGKWLRYDPDLKYGQGSSSDHLHSVGTRVIGDQDVLPAALRREISRSSHIEIVEMGSYPFEDMATGAWDLPMVLHLPTRPLEELDRLYGELVFRRLGVCDQVVAERADWPELQSRFGWPLSMLRSAPDQVAPERLQLAEEVLREASLRRGSMFLEWPLAIAGSKRRLNRQLEVVSDLVRGVRRASSRLPRVGLVGWQLRPFVPTLWPLLYSVSELRPSALERLEADYPFPPMPMGGRPSLAGDHRLDVGVGVRLGSQAGSPVHDYRRLAQRVAVGGRLIFLEQVSPRFRPDDVVEAILDGTAGRVVLHDVRLIKSTAHEIATTAVFCLSKIGG